MTENTAPTTLLAFRTRMNLSRREVAELVKDMTQAKLWRLEQVEDTSTLTQPDLIAHTAIYDALIGFEAANPAGKPKAEPKPKTPKAPKVAGYDKAQVKEDIVATLMLAQTAYVTAKAKKYGTAELTKVVDALMALKDKYTGE